MPHLVFRDICKRSLDNPYKGPSPEEARRKRIILVRKDDRPDFKAHELARIRFASKAEGDAQAQEAEGVFVIQAGGSKDSCLIGHPDHFPGISDGQKVLVDFFKADARDSVSWLKESVDGERLAFAHILETALKASDDATVAAASAAENLSASRAISAVATDTLDTAEETRRLAEEARLSAERDARSKWIYAVAGFVAGGLLDIGMIEEKFGITISPWFVATTAFLAVVAVAIATLRARGDQGQPRPDPARG